jgi:DNA-binding transcriptional ArsR family regulator
MLTSQADVPAPLDDQTAVRVYRALGDCTRYKIVRLLIERGEVACAELQTIFPLSAPCLSHHTRILQECGLIGLRKEGAYHFFQPRRATIARYTPGLLTAEGAAVLADCDE